MRKIRLIDPNGNKNRLNIHGGLNITKHSQVVEALERRLQRWRGAKSGVEHGGVHLDETGTIEFTHEELQEQREQERSLATELQESDPSLFRIHGVAAGRKQEGICRLVYENANGFNTRLTGNTKVSRAKKIIDTLEADIVAYNEIRVNWKHKANVNGLGKMFQGGGLDVRAVTAYNVHAGSTEKTQEGGTGMLAYGLLLNNLDHSEVSKDETGLGRWVIMTFKGSDGFVTRVLCGYNPCYNRSKTPNGTVYQQQTQYFITIEKDLTCPRTRFREDLIKLLLTWKEAGDRIIVCLDINEHIYKKTIGKALTDADGLALKEVIGLFTGEPIGATHFRGSKPIDGIWASSDLVVSNACVMPCGYGIGDHRVFIVDFLVSSMIGTTPVKIVRPAARRLNTRLPFVTERYTKHFHASVVRHRLMEKLNAIAAESVCSEETTARINQIDGDSQRYMIAAEKRCRRLRSGTIPFTPETAALIRQLRVYQTLLRNKLGHNVNRGNLVRTARRHRIDQPLSISLEELRKRIHAINEELAAAKVTGWVDRRKHLLECSAEARDRGDDVVAEQILEIIKREKERSFWRNIRHTMGKAQGRSVGLVQVQEDDGTVTEHTTQTSVQEAIWNEIHRKRFYLAEEAPICQGALRGEFGYLSVSPTAQAILDGTYEYPHDFDEDTKAICLECARIRSIIPADSVLEEITEEDWNNGWRTAREDTSSSESGLHFGHYRASTTKTLLAQFHSLKASLVMKHGIVLDRWSRGLSVMLEKMFGCTLISKLRSILLMEADFNFANKQIFGVRMLGAARKYKLMPEEIFSERNRMAEDGTLAKTLFYDITRQSRRPAGLASVDAESCYDRITHAIASLVFQAFGIPGSAAVAMLKTIQEMKFFLRTAYGDSPDFATSSLEIKSQGLCQGNGAAPAGWTVISITLLNAHKERGHSATFRCPISGKQGRMAGIIYVDDTDLLHINLERQELLEESHQSIQEAISSWGSLLLASGGSLKPEKCFVYLIDFEWLPDGTWKYANTLDDERYDVYIPLSRGRTASISRLGVNEARKTLGYMTCPSGDAGQSLTRMNDQAQEWIDKVISGGLPRRYVWFMMDKQFWPRVGYGICNNLASVEELAKCLMRAYYKILPLGGVVRSAPKELRQLAGGFYGIGCPHPGVECFIAQLNRLIMHYGCQSNLGLQLQISMEYFILELGMSEQPFRVKYEKYGGLVTHSWLKTIWEKSSFFQVDIEVAVVGIDKLKPRNGDKWLMQVFVETGYTGDELVTLNRMRLNQQILYLSDIIEAGGRYLEEEAGIFCQGERRSRYNFPIESPTESDLLLWRQAIAQLAPRGRLQYPLREFQTQGHRIWRWRLHEDAQILTFLPEYGEMQYYRPVDSPRQRRSSNRWALQAEAPQQQFEDEGKFCSVIAMADGEISIRGIADPPPLVGTTTFWSEALLEFGGEWMWENLIIEGDENWVTTSIGEGTCMAVCDGSYMDTVDPLVCSASFILECQRGRGRISGSFCEHSSVACSYRGELLGLLAIHLIVLSVCRANEAMTGGVDIYSDCKTALWTIETLPPTMIPARFKHADILKLILIHCREDTVVKKYIHVPAHQDNDEDFEYLSRQSQLNCLMDSRAKQCIWEWDSNGRKNIRRKLPLESVHIKVGKDKVTSNAGELVRIWAHRSMARSYFSKKHILYPSEFDSVDWISVHAALHSVPRLFQIWACKQVMGIAGTFKYRSKYESETDPMCPSCTVEEETCGHILHCREEGRVNALLASLDSLEEWLEEMETDPILVEGVMAFARGRGEFSMAEAYLGYPREYKMMGQRQDRIGWRRFMEGMIVTDLKVLQTRFLRQQNSRMHGDRWARELVVKLLECTHGQWLYRNVVVYEQTSGTAQAARKAEIREEILQQLERGGQTLRAEDQYLLEINLGDMDTGSLQKQEYWLRAIKAARIAKQISDEVEGIG